MLCAAHVWCDRCSAQLIGLCCSLRHATVCLMSNKAVLVTSHIRRLYNNSIEQWVPKSTDEAASLSYFANLIFSSVRSMALHSSLSWKLSSFFHVSLYRAQCSPSQGPCCTASCTVKYGDKCREDNGCRDPSYCDGRMPQCPPSVNKPNKTICNEEFVCYMGVSIFEKLPNCISFTSHWAIFAKMHWPKNNNTTV